MIQPIVWRRGAGLIVAVVTIAASGTYWTLTHPGHPESATGLDAQSATSRSRPAEFVSAPSAYDATVKRVIDGNTLVVSTHDWFEVLIRLAGIEAPAIDQPFGVEAREQLATLVSVGRVRVIATEDGIHPGGIARVEVDGRNVSAELLRSGAAWVARDGASAPELLAIEQEARRANVGLWSLPNGDRMRPCWWRGDC